MVKDGGVVLKRLYWLGKVKVFIWRLQVEDMGLGKDRGYTSGVGYLVGIHGVVRG